MLHLPHWQHTFQNGPFNGLRDKFRKAFILKHFPGAADGIGRQGNHGKILIHSVIHLTDMFQCLYPVKSRHHMIKENNIVSRGCTALDGLLAAKAGIYLDIVAA